MISELKVIVSPKRGNIVVLVIDGELYQEELQEDEILVELDNFNDYYKPKRDGKKWVEGLSQAELNEIEAEKNKPQPPTEVELLKNQIKAATERSDFLEELIAEMAVKVY